MSRIVVVGGSGRTGILIVKQLVKAGDAVVATIRNPKHMATLVKSGAETTLIDLDSSPLLDIERVFKGADAIVFAAGSAAGESSALDRKGTVRTIKAAEKTGVKRYLTIASIGASTDMKFLGDWVKTPEMKDYYKQKKAANKALRGSALDWTIVEPGGLTDGKLTGKVKLSQEAIEEGQISRADVAAVVVACLADKKTIGKTFQLVGGKTAIADAIKAAAK